MLKIQDIDVDKMKVSKQKLYSKVNKAYKHYIMYDDNSEIIPLHIRLHEVTKYLRVVRQ